ncbi:MAG: hypothetical protein J0M16_00490 [Gammaproteobacteria bacterium]|nr:hypothetical protein [Gammaproteobacteria bacterium]
MATTDSIVVTANTLAQYRTEHSALVEKMYRAKSVLDLLVPELEKLVVSAEGAEASQRACNIQNVVDVVRDLLGAMPEQLENLNGALLN